MKKRNKTSRSYETHAVATFNTLNQDNNTTELNYSVVCITERELFWKAKQCLTWNSSDESTVVQICMLSKQEAVKDLGEEQKTDVQVSEEASFHKTDSSFVSACFHMESPSFS